MKINRKSEYFWPILLALLAHAAMILAFVFIHIPYADFLKNSMPTFDLDATSIEGDSSGNSIGEGAGDLANAILAAAGNSTDPTVNDVPLGSLLEDQKDERALLEPLEARKPQLAALSKSPQQRQTELFEIQNRLVKEKIEVGQKTVEEYNSFKTADLDRAGSGSSDVVSALNEASRSADQEILNSLGMDPEEGMPGFTPGTSSRYGTTSGSALGQGLGEKAGGLGRFERLDQFLDIEVLTFEESGDDQKYFVIKICAKPGAQARKVQPKEMLLTMDASVSISVDRLEEFKRGIRYCLENLNKGDTFNIIAFKDRVSFFMPHSVAATPDTIKRAEKFVSELTASERTDVYAVFDKIVKLPLDRKPSNVMLITDGRPTAGVVDSRELINSVTRINGKARPIFAFSGGAKVNRYLLDFAAYQNRAWSEFVKKTPDIDKGLARFYDKLKDPLFLNLRYRLNAVSEENVFPKALPDFYKGAEFTLYGTYHNDNDFSIQLLGDSDGATKELIFKRALKNATKGGAEIRQAWAFNKIYALISQLTEQGSSPALLSEIRDLSKRYGIATPYSPEIEAMDS